MKKKVYCRAKDVVLRDMAGEHFLIVLNAGESKMLNLNGMGKWFWEQLQTSQTKSQLLVTMLNQYEVEHEKAVAEIDSFIAYLEEKKLVVAENF